MSTTQQRARVGAPFVKGSDTSRQAAEQIAPVSGKIAQLVLVHIAATRGGATCHEVERALGLTHQTASARICELAQDQHIKDSGARRKTPSGRNAVVWIAGRGRAA